MNPRLPDSVQSLKPTELSNHEFNSYSKPTLYSYFNFIVCSVSSLISAIIFISRHIYIYIYIYIYVHIYIMKQLLIVQLKTVLVWHGWLHGFLFANEKLEKQTLEVVCVIPRCCLYFYFKTLLFTHKMTIYKYLFKRYMKADRKIFCILCLVPLWHSIRHPLSKFTLRRSRISFNIFLFTSLLSFPSLDLHKNYILYNTFPIILNNES